MRERNNIIMEYGTYMLVFLASYIASFLAEFLPDLYWFWHRI